jgi:hypothetical protein
LNVFFQTRNQILSLKAYHKANEERKTLTNEITDVRSMKNYLVQINTICIQNRCNIGHERTISNNGTY